MTLANTVAVAVHHYRTSQDLTMKALAGRAGISGQMISDIERGTRSPSLHTLERLATALDCEPFEFLIFERTTQNETY